MVFSNLAIIAIFMCVFIPMVGIIWEEDPLLERLKATTLRRLALQDLHDRLEYCVQIANDQFGWVQAQALAVNRVPTWLQTDIQLKREALRAAIYNLQEFEAQHDIY